MPPTRSLFLILGIAAALLPGCGDRDPEPPPPAPPPAAVPSLPVAELTGWPAGLGRALVLSLSSPGETYRLVVPELGDHRFADSAISVKVGDSVSVVLLGRRGKAGDARLRIIDAEAGTGSCVTWPSAEISAATFGRRRSAVPWRLALERDSVTPVAVDSLLGMRGADSAALANAVSSLLAAVPAPRDSTLLGVPFGIRRAYSFRASGIATIAAELARVSSSEADPREERLFVIGEREGEPPAYRLAYSRRNTGRADSTAVMELLGVVVSRQSGRAVIVLGAEDPNGLRLHLLERAGRRRWRSSWSSVVTFC